MQIKIIKSNKDSPIDSKALYLFLISKYSSHTHMRLTPFAIHCLMRGDAIWCKLQNYWPQGHQIIGSRVSHLHPTIRVHLVGEILGRMEKIGEKSGEKIISMGVWLERWENGILVRSGCFLPRPTKNQSLQFGEKMGEKRGTLLQRTILPPFHIGSFFFFFYPFFFPSLSTKIYMGKLPTFFSFYQRSPQFIWDFFFNIYFNQFN